jgi:hypothetical protein
MVVPSAGVYTVGLYDSPDATETDRSFPLPVVQGQPVRAASETTLGSRVIEPIHRRVRG